MMHALFGAGVRDVSVARHKGARGRPGCVTPAKLRLMKRKGEALEGESSASVPWGNSAYKFAERQSSTPLRRGTDAFGRTLETSMEITAPALMQVS